MALNLFRDQKQPELFPAPDRKLPWREIIIVVLLLCVPAAYFTGSRGRPDCAEPVESAGPGDVQPQFPAEFAGRYQLDVGGHRGYLIVYAGPGGAPAATLQFTNWGKKVPEPLWNVSISGRTLTFLRACQGARCAQIGASAPFQQIYTGELQPGDAEIRGTYTGGQSASSWSAKRI